MNRHTFKYICNNIIYDYEVKVDRVLEAMKYFVEHCEENEHFEITLIDMRSYVRNTLTPTTELI
jgi:hypothetical protein